MDGYSRVVEIQELQERVTALGFKWGHTLHSDAAYGSTLTLYPRDDELPIYNRAAPIFTGTITGLKEFLKGVTWAREYDCMMKISTAAVRDRKEQDLRNKQTVELIKNEPVTTYHR